MYLYSPLQKSNCSLGEGTTCSVVNITTITCSTPDLLATSPTVLNYTLLFDDVPPTTQARLPISVQSDPSNFRLTSSQEVTTGTETSIRIVVCLIATTDLASFPASLSARPPTIKKKNRPATEASRPYCLYTLLKMGC